MNQLEQLSKFTVVVADTGDYEAIKQYEPTDSTTNPSLVLKALNAMTETEKNNFIKIATDYVQAKYSNKNSNSNSNSANTENEQKSENSGSDSDSATAIEKAGLAVDRLAVEFGLQILKVIPGYVSTELDARLSYDIKNSVKRAVNIIAMYEELGIKNARDRVLIKVATTWEGVQVAKILREQHSIRCNMTLLFSIWQAAAAAQIADAYLISPFVGRITDWHKAKQSVDGFNAYTEDPGVKSVRNIFAYYRMIKASTIVMGASFRNIDQILALAGCDRLTIAPKFLLALQNNKTSGGEVVQYLDAGNVNADYNEYKTKFEVNEQTFRFGMCFDACATEKLAEGIRKFAKDIITLENILKTKL